MLFYCIAKTGEGVNTGMAKLNTNQMANPLVASHAEKLNTKMNTCPPSVHFLKSWKPNGNQMANLPPTWHWLPTERQTEHLARKKTIWGIIKMIIPRFRWQAWPQYNGLKSVSWKWWFRWQTWPKYLEFFISLWKTRFRWQTWPK